MTKLHLCVVCTGNICRSPMGDVVLSAAIREAGLDTVVVVTSCGTGGWHVGDKADERALQALDEGGYDGHQHRAAQFGPAHAEADLFLVMDEGHARSLRRSGVDQHRIRLWNSFTPGARTLEVDDPYYGPYPGFQNTLRQVEEAIPGIMAWITQTLDARP